jgi:hypothetical protein
MLKKRILYVILLLVPLFFSLKSAISDVSLSNKISVTISIDYGGSDKQETLIKQKIARLEAKEKILKNHFLSNYKLPSFIKLIHKDFFLDLVFNDAYKDVSLKNFEENINSGSDNQIKYSAFVIQNNINYRNPFNILKKNAYKKIKFHELLLLEFSYIYVDKINYDEALTLLLNNYNNNLHYVFDRKKIRNYKFIKYLNIKFIENELPNDLDQLLAMYDKAIFNLDLCLKLVKELSNKKFNFISKKVSETCYLKKNLANIKTQKEYLSLTNKYSLKNNSLFNAIILFDGKLPVYFENKNNGLDQIKNLNLKDLIVSFEKSPSIQKIDLLKNKFKDLNLLNLVNIFNEQSLLSQW